MTDRPELDLRGFAELTELLDDAHPQDPRPFIGVHGSAGTIAAVMALLAPPFVEHRGAVLRGFRTDLAVVDDWFDRLGDVAAVEKVVNHVHVWDLLPSRGFDAREAELLVEPMAWFWHAALDRAFPGRRFVVDAVRDGDYGPELTFFTAGPAVRPVSPAAAPGG
ncbi:hypothetical protein GC089_17110 [Cellulomonas sp. JZ18]|uniref:hypothetical protein n=1 Tax=Cellulomonas sp. JZ18 TaxID=2654191 RepID=UPI0012D44270|nr:hypothetical protein [Cellulomonas sp. JZ18]QGQ20592.1 hypothetical protein GC089_17110 [Cellulomonas sp. JZ18]